jgi:CRISPR type I-E-associated protein CasB/Cse2
MSATTTTESPFLDHLRRALDGDRKRGERAALRRYWSPATRSQSYPILGQLGALEDTRKAILAALYAQHPEHQPGITIGKAALQLGKREDGKHPFDLHFRRLLACQEIGHIHAPADLPAQLHRLVKRLSKEGIPLDYAALHKNLYDWANHRENVLLRWASDFWNTPLPADL